MGADMLWGLMTGLPSQCAVCRAWPARALCEACVARFAQPRPRCLRCALPLGGGAAVCGTCLREPPPLDACLVAVSYGYPWSELLTQFKFRARPGHAGALATLLRSTPWVEPALEAADAVLPLPLSPARLAQRGFNQSLELARRLAPAKTQARWLRRWRETAPQTELDRHARLANVRGAFAVEPGAAARLRGARVVLVDDVMTSGATLFAAAQAVREAGAAHITGLALARTDDH